MPRKRRRLTETAEQVIELFLREPEREWYGWDILGRSESVSASGLYRILDRFEREFGWLESRWEQGPSDPSKPPKRLYRLRQGADVDRGIAEALAEPRSRSARPAGRLWLPAGGPRERPA
jgi:hypothetical protein